MKLKHFWLVQIDFNWTKLKCIKKKNNKKIKNLLL
jgi:hypothetical protein